MPYVNCRQCRIPSFVPAAWGSAHNCPNCEAALVSPRKNTAAGDGMRAGLTRGGARRGASQLASVNQGALVQQGYLSQLRRSAGWASD